MTSILHYEAGKSLFGGAYQVAGLLERTQEAFAHELFCARGSAIAEAARPFARIHATPLGGELDPRPYFALKRLLRAERPALLHLHSRRGADLWGPLAARQTGTPFILTRRVDNLEPGPLLRWRCRGAAAVVAISEGIATALAKMGLPREAVEVIRSGVDTATYRPRANEGRLRAAFDLPANALTVGMIAQFIPRKGHADLVAASRSIIEAFPQTVFILFGKGEQWHDIQQAVKQQEVASSFRFPGFRDDLPSLLPELDLLVHPAHQEGLGVALLQASACGVPVVAGAAGGIPEIVRHEKTGLLVPPGKVAALALAVRQLLRDPDRRRAMGAAGRAFIEDEVSLDQTAAGNAALYRRVLGESAQKV